MRALPLSHGDFPITRLSLGVVKGNASCVLYTRARLQVCMCVRIYKQESAAKEKDKEAGTQGKSGIDKPSVCGCVV